MNNLRDSFPKIFILLILLIMFSMGMHFLHDIQPGHSDLFGNTPGGCNAAIHYGFLASSFAGLLFVALIIKFKSIKWPSPRSRELYIIVPPPIFQ